MQPESGQVLFHYALGQRPKAAKGDKTLKKNIKKVKKSETKLTAGVLKKKKKKKIKHTKLIYKESSRYKATSKSLAVRLFSGHKQTNDKGRMETSRNESVKKSKTLY